MERLLKETEYQLAQTTLRRLPRKFSMPSAQDLEALHRLLLQFLNIYNRKEVTLFFKKFPDKVFSFSTGSHVAITKQCGKPVYQYEIPHCLVIRKGGIFWTDQCVHHTGTRLFRDEETLKQLLLNEKQKTLIAELAAGLLSYYPGYFEQTIQTIITESLESIGLPVLSFSLAL